MKCLFWKKDDLKGEHCRWWRESKLHRPPTMICISSERDGPHKWDCPYMEYYLVVPIVIIPDCIVPLNEHRRLEVE